MTVGDDRVIFVREPAVVLSGQSSRQEIEAVPAFHVLVACAQALNDLEFEAMDPDGGRIDDGDAGPWDADGTWQIDLPEGRAVIELHTSDGLRGRVDVDVGPALENSAPIAVELR
jgi:hypothetical protein